MTFDEAKKEVVSTLLRISESGHNFISSNYIVQIESFFEKRSLPQAKYVDQLQKNIPYNKFLFTYTLDNLVDYIFSVSRDYGQLGAEKIIDSAQVKSAQSVPFVHRYLSGVSFSVDGITDDFKELKRLHANDSVKFFDEAEFQMRYYKSHYVTVTYFVNVLTHEKNNNFLNFMASKFQRGDISEMIRAVIRKQSGMLMAL